MNKKYALAILLCLLASASALVASLFLLQELKDTSTLPKQVDNLRQAIQNINSEVDISGVENRITSVESEVSKLGSNMLLLENNQKPEKTVVDSPPVEPITETPDLDSVVNDGTVKTTSRLNLRSQPGKDTSVMKTLERGISLKILGDEVTQDGYNWIKISEINGSSGWVAKKYTK